MDLRQTLKEKRAGRGQDGVGMRSKVLPANFSDPHGDARPVTFTVTLGEEAKNNVAASSPLLRAKAGIISSVSKSDAANHSSCTTGTRTKISEEERKRLAEYRCVAESILLPPYLTCGPVLQDDIDPAVQRDILMLMCKFDYIRALMAHVLSYVCACLLLSFSVSFSHA